MAVNYWAILFYPQIHKIIHAQDTLSLDSGTRDKLRGSDYREILIVLPKQLRGERTRTEKHTQIELGICPCPAQCVSAVTSMVMKQLNVLKRTSVNRPKDFSHTSG